MATPAAILGILVKASTTEANLALAKTDAQLNATTASAERTTAATSTTGQTMKKMGTAAKLAGAAIAVGFIIEAKKAIDTTQELTKSTISLHNNLGIATKKSSEWAAVARARGVDSTKLGMAFKTMSTQVQAARDGSDSANKAFQALGISQKELAAGSKDVNGLILEVADGMENLGAGTERTAITGQLFGRGWQTIAPLMRDGSAALKENLDLTEKYGATLSGKTFKAQEELLANTRESKLAWMGLQVSLANFVTPALNDLHDQFQKIAAIMASGKLTDDEKFRKVADIIQKDFQKALDVALGLIPEFASQVGQAAPKVAMAFIEGFLNADSWGKLALGAWFFTKVGLTGAAMKAAAGRLALIFGGTFAAESAAATTVGAGAGGAAGGMFAKVAPAAAAAGTTAGTSFGASFVAAFALPAAGVGALAGGLELLTRAREKAGQADIEIVKSVGEFNQALDKMKGSYGSLTKAVSAMSGKQQEDFIKTAQTLADEGAMSQKMVYRLQQAVVDSTERQKKAWRDLAQELGMTTKQVKNATGSMARTFINDLTAMGHTNTSVLKAIADDTNAELRAFGVDEVTFRSSGVAGGATGPGHLGQRKQRGGMIGGSGTGDKVHVLAEPGEGFINSRAVKAMGGKGAIDAINKAVPRFQKGGTVSGLDFALGPYTVPPIQYDPDHAGANSHVHISAFSIPWLISVGHKIQQMGNSVGEFQPTSAGNPYGFGPVTTSAHAHYPTDHYSGHAVDVNSLRGAENQAWVGSIANVLGGAAGVGGAMAEKIARVLIKGPDGPWKDTLQASADKAVKGANAYIAKKMPTMSTGFDTAGAAGGWQGINSAGEFIPFWNKTTHLPAFANAFSKIVPAESGWNPTANNGTHAGWYQFDSPTWSDFRPDNSGWPAGPYNPGLATIAAGNVARREGQAGVMSRWAATFQGFGKGGTVPGPIGRPMPAIVHGGETISPAGKPHVEVNVYGGMVEDVEVLIDGKMPEIADYVIREGGRNRARSRQLAGSAGRG